MRPITLTVALFGGWPVIKFFCQSMATRFYNWQIIKHLDQLEICSPLAQPAITF